MQFALVILSPLPALIVQPFTFIEHRLKIIILGIQNEFQLKFSRTPVYVCHGALLMVFPHCDPPPH